MREREITDPLADKLGRFTPDTTGLDRDTLLFEAGQASVHPRRLWPFVAGLLALSQAATLLFFLTRSIEPATPMVVAPRPEQTIPMDNLNVLPTLDEPRQWTWRRATLNADVDQLPALQPIENAAPPQKVFTVLSISSVLTIE